MYLMEGGSGARAVGCHGKLELCQRTDEIGGEEEKEINGKGNQVAVVDMRRRRAQVVSA